MSSLRCPVCGKLLRPDQTAALPFCSQRCRQTDLARWLEERYGLPHEAPQEEEDSEGRPPDSRAED